MRKRPRRKKPPAATPHPQPEVQTPIASSSSEPPAGAQSPSQPAPAASDAELGRIIGEIKASAPTVEAPPAGAAPGATAANADEEALLGIAERLAEGDATVLDDLTPEDIGDIFSLLFGLAADQRGPHWELPDASARRIGKWVKRSIERHGWDWLLKYIPDVMAIGIVTYEIGKRVRMDRQLAATAAETKDAA